MLTSQNGWPASSDPAAIGVKPFVVAGRDFPGGVKAGPVATVLRYVVANFHCRVESLYYGDVDKDDWGWSYRPIRGQTTGLSNHAAGCAVDVNATTNQRGKTAAQTFTYAQQRTIHAILREAGGVVRWGGDYQHAVPDTMHFEVIGTPAQVAAVAKRLLNPAWFTRDLKVGMRGEDVKVVQRRLGFTGRAVDGVFGPRTMGAVNAFRGRLLLSENGTVNKALAYYIGTSA